MILNNPPRDKSLTHRALFLAALSHGTSKISHPLLAKDTKATVKCLRKIGIKITLKNSTLIIAGNPDLFYQAKNLKLDCQNSGTTLRHLIALLVNSEGQITLTGDNSLQSRPMNRIVDPLLKLGAKIIYLKKHSTTAPLKIMATKKLKSGTINLNVASAQVKSALLLYAALNRKSIKLKGKIQSRNHTENFLKYLGTKIITTHKKISFSLKKPLPSFHLSIPADPSSTLYYLFLFQFCRKNSACLQLPHHYYNKTRCTSWDMLKKAGYELNFKKNSSSNQHHECVESTGTLYFKVSTNKKKGFSLSPAEVSYVIDEIPLLLAWALFLDEPSIFRSIEELSYKESDRLKEVQRIFTCFGIENHLTKYKHHVTITPLKNTSLERIYVYQGEDHRMVMLYQSLLIISNKKHISKNMLKKNLSKKEEKIIQISNPQWSSDLVKILS